MFGRLFFLFFFAVILFKGDHAPYFPIGKNSYEDQVFGSWLVMTCLIITLCEIVRFYIIRERLRLRKMRMDEENARMRQREEKAKAQAKKQEGGGESKAA